MKKVFQTIHGRKNGNCLPAVMASLFEMNIEDVPHFNKFDNWYEEFIKFIESKECTIKRILYNAEDARIRNLKGHQAWYNSDNPKDDLNDIKKYQGIDGFFHCGVYSPNNYDPEDEHPAMHAVIIDKDFNIIHDPEKAYQDVKSYPRADDLGFNGIIDIFVIEKK
jgi:hypothetical protein